MANKRPKGFGDMPSSGDLGRLMGCEAEFVAERRDGLVSTARGRRQASELGEAAHLQAQVSMETFHNRSSRSQPDTAAPQSARDSRCFVASAVYGSDAPQTEQLREFRDERLMRTVPGRTFVRLYYRFSPPLLRAVGDRPFVLHLVRRALDLFRRRVVARS